MEINLSQAVKLFYNQSSFDMVYLEAIANALDADATAIEITFNAESLTNTKSFHLTIEDNGVGFTDDRYEKFCKLLDVNSQDRTHRGLGRLVYLFYFDTVRVQSNYDKTKYREFLFNEELGAGIGSFTTTEQQTSSSKLEMSGYNPSRLRDKNFVDTEWIRKRILKKYYSRLYLAKEEKRGITITISSTIGESTETKIIDVNSLPTFEEKKFPSPHSLDGEMRLLYSIKKCDHSESSVITAISVDDRNESIDVYAEESMPQGYEMVFILFSDSFQGQTDVTRQNISLSSSTIKMLKRTFRTQIIAILSEKLPHVIKATKVVNNQLNEKYPHLSGYFENDTIGISSKNDILKEAQNRFFQDQREMLSKTDLTEEEFEQSLDLSGRALTEYIVFRQLTIDRLKKIDKKDLESKIHNIIVPKRTVLQAQHLVEDVYKNNSWILDDKFMAYSTILSEMEMTALLQQITDGEIIPDDGRPDIAIIFSNDPKITKKVDVVIVELKKKGLKPEENVRVEVQLEKRARKLYDIYGEKIQSLWLYGVVELDEEYKLHLDSAGYHPLYSEGTLFVNTNDITVQFSPRISIPAVRYIMDLKAVINDADARNNTFLNIIKSKFVKS